MSSDSHNPELDRRARRIKLLLMDCDGVLTDGRIELLENGDEQKTFHTRDGQGISLLHQAGLKTGIISGRSSSAVERRARDLKMTYVRQGAQDKVAALEEILALAGLTVDQCGYIGDDLGDIPVMLRVEFAAAVGDAVFETQRHAHYVTQLPGGHGAVREVADFILQRQGHWHELMKRFTD